MNRNGADDDTSDPSNPYAVNSPTLVFQPPPDRWFEVETLHYETDGGDCVMRKENVIAHTVNVTDAGVLIFQVMRPSRIPTAYDPAKGEGPGQAKPLGPSALDYVTVRIFNSSSYVGMRETMVESPTASRLAN
jgi:hypothetical protein